MSKSLLPRHRDFTLRRANPKLNPAPAIMEDVFPQSQLPPPLPFFSSCTSQTSTLSNHFWQLQTTTIFTPTKTPYKMFTPRRLPSYLYDNADGEKTPTTRIVNAFYQLVTPTKNALMAFRNRFLICYYCNVKSSIKFQSGITSFVCPCCDAENFLDEVSIPPLLLEHADTD